jgi:hypothetical protein
MVKDMDPACCDGMDATIYSSMRVHAQICIDNSDTCLQEFDKFRRSRHDAYTQLNIDRFGWFGETVDKQHGKQAQQKVQ